MDGVDVTSDSWARTFRANGADLVIGAKASTYADPFNGLIDEVKLYDQVVDPASFNELPGSPGPTPPAQVTSFVASDGEEGKSVLTWTNPIDMQGSALLYRHSAEIGSGNLEQAELIARLTTDRESYEDAPMDLRPYYYAVLIEDGTGKIHELFVPFRNKTSQSGQRSLLPTVKRRKTASVAVRAIGCVRGIFMSRPPSCLRD